MHEYSGSQSFPDRWNIAVVEIPGCSPTTILQGQSVGKEEYEKNIFLKSMESAFK